MSSYGQKLGPDMAINIVEILEWLVVIFGISAFFVDSLLSTYQISNNPNYDSAAANMVTMAFLGTTYNVRETSIWCLAFSILNVFLPNGAINEWIFGESQDETNAPGYSECEKTEKTLPEFLKVKDTLLLFLYY
jgi:hypothetical protein